MDFSHIFAGNPLDRADQQRRDPVWLEGARNNPASRFLPFSELNVLVDESFELRIAWLALADIGRLRTTQPPVFLGLRDGIAHFALDVSELGDVAHELNLDDSVRFEDARAAAMRLPGADTGIVAQARSQLGWHKSHRHCSVCGAPTTSARGGHVRVCGACNSEHFPRTDPVAIMLISDGERCLLGQSVGRLAGSGMYSALAGFIDQGESIEEAVRREVREEAGVIVGAVRYHSSQPWPFPSSLMIGCLRQALTTDIRIDPEEMTDVAWFSRDVVRAALQEHFTRPSAGVGFTRPSAGVGPTLRVPGPIAIAHHLIKAWCEGDIEI